MPADLTKTPDVAIVVSPRDWAERLHRFLADHGGARVRARILDAREAVDEDYTVLVAEDLTSFLTPRLVRELHQRNRQILGVFDPTEPWGRERLLELGVDEVTAADEAPEALIHTITALAARVELERSLGDLVHDDGSGPTDARPAGHVAAEPDGTPSRRGSTTVVLGPAGGPGATEVALGLAAASASRRERAVVLDADDVAPSVAQRLGLALHPNLRSALDTVQHLSGDIADHAQGVAAGRFDVVAGLPDPANWADARPDEVVDLVSELAVHYDQVVVDVGHRLEELGAYTGGAGRYGIARAVVAAADRLVLVAAPDPVGLSRLLETVADVRTLSRAPIAVAVNRAPRGRFRQGEYEDELRRTFSPRVLRFLPEDRRVQEAAWDGTVVRGGPFSKAVAQLASEVLPAAAPRRAARVAASGGARMPTPQPVRGAGR